MRKIISKGISLNCTRGNMTLIEAMGYLNKNLFEININFSCPILSQTLHLCTVRKVKREKIKGDVELIAAAPKQGPAAALGGQLWLCQQGPAQVSRVGSPAGREKGEDRGKSGKLTELLFLLVSHTVSGCTEPRSEWRRNAI